MTGQIWILLQQRRLERADEQQKVVDQNVNIRQRAGDVLVLAQQIVQVWQLRAGHLQPFGLGFLVGLGIVRDAIEAESNLKATN